MSLKSWLQNRWLVEHRTSADEINGLLGVARRDLGQADVAGLDSDWKLAIAYNAALQVAAAALSVAGFRPANEGHHYRLIESLLYTVEVDPEDVRLLQQFRLKRHRSLYQRGGMTSDTEANEMRRLAGRLHDRVKDWIRSTHPDLLKS